MDTALDSEKDETLDKISLNESISSTTSRLSFENDVDDLGAPDTPTKIKLRSSLHAKKRLQAYSNQKAILSPILGRSKDKHENNKDKPKKMLIKNITPDEKAKATIEEIEQLKKTTQPVDPNSWLIKKGKKGANDVNLPIELPVPTSRVYNLSDGPSRGSRSRSKSLEREGGFFKKREKTIRNYRKSDLFENEQPDSHQEVKDKPSSKTKIKHKYPENWKDFNSKNLTFGLLKDLKSNRSTSSHHLPNDLLKQNLFELPSEIISVFYMESNQGEEVMVPFQYIRHTETKPRIAYSVNHAKNKHSFYKREQVLKHCNYKFKHILTRFLNEQPKHKPLVESPKKDKRKWFPKSWKAVESSEAKQLETSIGLSFLQSYSDEEEEEINDVHYAAKNKINDELLNLNIFQKTKSDMADLSEEIPLKIPAFSCSNTPEGRRTPEIEPEPIVKKTKNKKHKKDSDLDSLLDKYKKTKKAKKTKKKAEEDILSDVEEEKEEKPKKKKKVIAKKKRSKVKKAKLKKKEKSSKKSKKSKEDPDEKKLKKLKKQLAEMTDDDDEEEDEEFIPPKKDKKKKLKKQETSDEEEPKPKKKKHSKEEKGKSEEKHTAEPRTEHNKIKIELKTIDKNKKDHFDIEEKSARNRSRSKSRTKSVVVVPEKPPKKDKRIDEQKTHDTKIDKPPRKHIEKPKHIEKKQNYDAFEIEPKSKSRSKSREPKQKTTIDQKGTPDTDDYTSNWESDDGLTTQVSWDSETNDRKDQKKARSPFNLEIPLNIPRREPTKVNSPGYIDVDIEIKRLAEERKSLSEERRRLELEKIRLQELEIRKLEETYAHDHQKHILNKEELKRKKRQSRWGETSILETSTPDLNATKVSDISSSNDDIISSIISISNSPDVTSSKSDVGGLESEYEQFLKAVSNDTKAPANTTEGTFIKEPLKRKRDDPELQVEPLEKKRKDDILLPPLPIPGPVPMPPPPVESAPSLQLGADISIDTIISIESISSISEEVEPVVEEPAVFKEVPASEIQTPVKEVTTEPEAKPFAFSGITLKTKQRLNASGVKLDDNEDETEVAELLKLKKQQFENFKNDIKGERKQTEVSTKSSTSKKDEKTTEKHEKPTEKHSDKSKKHEDTSKSVKKDKDKNESGTKRPRSRSRSPRKPAKKPEDKRRSLGSRRTPSPRRRSNRRSPLPRRRGLSPRRRVSPSRRRSPIRNRKDSRFRRSSLRRSLSPRRRRNSMSPRRSSIRPPSPKSGKEIRRSKSPLQSPLDGPKRSMAPDSTISDDLLPQPSISESPIAVTSTLKERRVGSPGSPKRLSLDDRINQVLGLQNEPLPKAEVPYNQYNYAQDYGYGQFGNYYQNYNNKSIPTTVAKSNNKVLQVGNILQVVPTDDLVQPETVPQKVQQIVQVGNMLQIVPTPIELDKVPLPRSPKTEKLPEKVSPETLIKQKNAERRAEREKRRLEREARRNEKEKKRKDKEKAKQIKLKIRTENMIKKALQLETEQMAAGGEEIEEEEEPETFEWSETPVLIGDLSKDTKSILVSRTETDTVKPEKRKSVQFADGIRPGEGTSPSGGEELSSPPPVSTKMIKLKKKKVPRKSKKRKIKVKVIKKRNHIPESSDDTDDYENLPPPSPPPGSPPPHIFPPRVKTHTLNNLPPTAIYNLPPNVVSVIAPQSTSLSSQVSYQGAPIHLLPQAQPAYVTGVAGHGQSGGGYPQAVYRTQPLAQLGNLGTMSPQQGAALHHLHSLAPPPPPTYVDHHAHLGAPPPPPPRPY